MADHHHPPLQSPASRPISRSDSAHPYPTTFVQADSSSFKQVVQMLTGSPDSSPSPPQPSKTHIPPMKSSPKKPQSSSGFKLYERRNSLKKFKINTLNSLINKSATGFSPCNPEILSPTILDFPSLVLSPVTPLIRDPFDRSAVTIWKGGSGNLDRVAEERGIKEKGFYLHPSPSSTPMDTEPQLLPLFPVTSPRVTGKSSLRMEKASLG